MISVKPLFLALLISLTTCERTVDRNIESHPIMDEKINEIEPKSHNSEDQPSGKIFLKGQITRIVDGDTGEFLYNGELPLMIRLQHIDAPEKRGKQPYGNKAKQILSDLCFGQKVTVITDGEFDMGGRLIGEIINEENINVNKEMVRLGYAWHFKKYSEDLSYDILEKEARNNRRGLWQEPSPVAPWNYRR